MTNIALLKYWKS